MKHDTQKEIGEHLEEITAKGFEDLHIDVDDSGDVRKCGVYVRNPVTYEDHWAEADTLADALGFIVDSIRKEAGQPSREEEIAALLADDASHANAPPVPVGPDACCGCGSQKSLIVVRHFTFCIDWQGRAWIPWDDNTKRGLDVRPGEIGTCPDCGRNYTFGA